jgi:hypothetical protein
MMSANQYEPFTVIIVSDNNGLLLAVSSAAPATVRTQPTAQ